MRATGISVASTHGVFQRYDLENGFMSVLNVKIRHSDDKQCFRCKEACNISVASLS
jgi:hypothetical protein